MQILRFCQAAGPCNIIKFLLAPAGLDLGLCDSDKIGPKENQNKTETESETKRGNMPCHWLLADFVCQGNARARAKLKFKTRDLFNYNEFRLERFQRESAKWHKLNRRTEKTNGAFLCSEVIANIVQYVTADSHRQYANLFSEIRPKW